MISPDQFLTRTLWDFPGRKAICRVLAAAINGVEPGGLIQQHLFRRGSLLQVSDLKIDLKSRQNVLILSIGKAALPMAAAAGKIIGERLAEGIVLTKHEALRGWDQPIKNFKIYSGGHPLPDQAGFQAAETIISTLENLSENDLLLVLLSGGGSAIFSCPSPGISLTELIETNSLLLKSGADIVEINTIRKHLSRVKGGQLARIASPAAVFTLILSDVIQDRIDMIASGPTAPDPTTYQDAVEILQKYHLTGQVPASVLTHLKSGQKGTRSETPKPSDELFSRVENRILGGNQLAVNAGLQQARREGFLCQALHSPLVDSSHQVALQLANTLTNLSRDENPFPRPACMIGGGEPSVAIAEKQDIGLGGRNLETALHAVPLIKGLPNSLLIALASDGEDGPTDAAGAVASGETWGRAKKLKLDPDDYLPTHNSYTFFSELEDLVKTGPTRTNVNDLFFLFTI